MIRLFHKKLWLTSFLFSLGICATSQDEMSDLISASGGTYTGDEMVIDYSLGFWTVLNMDNSNGQISNGLFNEKYIIVSTSEMNADNLQLGIYPNPASEWLNLKILDSSTYPKRCTILDSNGRTVSKSFWPIGKEEIKMNISQLASEMYYLNMYGENNELLNTLKFIKIK